MRLSLTLTGGPPVADRDKVRTVSSGSISIGRGPGNDWVLPDPDRSLSKNHCEIAIEGTRFILTDTSTNGLFINGATQATERDSRIVLNDGDKVRLGAYIITAAAVADEAFGKPNAPADPGQDYHPVMADPGGFAIGGPGGFAIGGAAPGKGPLDFDRLEDPIGNALGAFNAPGSRDPVFQHPVPIVAIQPRGPDPFDQSHARGGHQAIDPNDDMFRGIQPSNEWQGASRPDNVPITSQAMPSMRIVPAPTLGEIDFDALIGDLGGHGGSFAPPPPAPVSREPAPVPVAPAPVAPAPVAPAPVAPAHRGTPPPAYRDPEPPAYREPPPLAPAPVSALSADQEPAAPRPAVLSPPRASPVANPFAESPADADPMAVTLGPLCRQPAPPAATAAPLAAVPPPAAGPTTGVATAATAATDSRAALKAFLEGAGVPSQRLDDADPEAALRAAGQVFRAMTEGLREVLISRAAIKSELRLEQTMIASQGNNALKFSVTADDAVAALLTPKRPGYMAPLAATKEALNDIKSHEIAVMAGVQTALLALLRRFDPDELEKRLTIGGLSAVMPGARKSRYWDGFRQTYGDITREAEDDFQSVFGRPFAKAYAAQTRKD